MIDTMAPIMNKGLARSAGSCLAMQSRKAKSTFFRFVAAALLFWFLCHLDLIRPRLKHMQHVQSTASAPTGVLLRACAAHAGG